MILALQLESLEQQEHDSKRNLTPTQHSSYLYPENCGYGKEPGRWKRNCPVVKRKEGLGSNLLGPGPSKGFLSFS